MTTAAMMMPKTYFIYKDPFVLGVIFAALGSISVACRNALAKSFKAGFRDVMRIVAVKVFNMNGRFQVVGDGGEKFFKNFRVQLTHFFRWKSDVPDKSRSTA